MSVLKQTFRYLKRTRGLKLTYRKPDSVVCLSGYSDADFAGCRNTRKSTTGNVFQIAGNTICWRSVKQRCVSTSTVEAECIPLSTSSKQQIWLQNALKELHVDIPCSISADNDGSIDLSENPRISDKSKHIDVAYHHIRDLVETGKITVLWIPSATNFLVGICTKPLLGPKFLNLRKKVLRAG